MNKIYAEYFNRLLGRKNTKYVLLIDRVVCINALCSINFWFAIWLHVLHLILYVEVPIINANQSEMETGSDPLELHYMVCIFYCAFFLIGCDKRLKTKM